MNQEITSGFGCTLCMWEGKSVNATYNAVAPDKSTHNLCDRHMAMYSHKYTSVLSIAQYKRMQDAYTHTILGKKVE